MKPVLLYDTAGSMTLYDTSYKVISHIYSYIYLLLFKCYEKKQISGTDHQQEARWKAQVITSRVILHHEATVKEAKNGMKKEKLTRNTP